MPKIVILDGYTANPGDLSWNDLKKYGDVTIYDRTPADKTVERIGDADIVYTSKVVLTEEVFAACPSIRFVCVLATGVNMVDIEAAKKRGITVTNIPAYSSDAVGQATIAMLLEICHHVAHHDKAVREGRWETCPDFCFWEYPLIELAGKTMGIIGYGRIGKVTARIAKALGMRVIAYTRSGFKDDTTEYATLDEIYAQSDVISLHCPLDQNNAGMINRDSIAKMRDGVIILNSSRGALINEQDLADALESGKVYAAGVDVVSAEPIKGDNPLLTAKNCFITPHIAWASKESRGRLVSIAINNLKNYLEGTPINVVS